VPANPPGHSRSCQNSRASTGSGPWSARASSTLGSPHQYRSIQPKPAAAAALRFLPSGVVPLPLPPPAAASRVAPDRPPSFDWIPAAAHGSRPLPAAHGPPPLRGVAAASGLSLTIDDQAPLDCSRKSADGGVEPDVEDPPAVLNLTTSRAGNYAAAAASPGLSPASPDHVEQTLKSSARSLPATSLPNSAVQSDQTQSTAGPSPGELIQAEGRRDTETAYGDLETTSDDVKTEEPMDSDAEQLTSLQPSAALQGLLVSL